MGKDSKIEWTDHTFNPWWGCVKIAQGCANCYARAWAKRTGFDVWGLEAKRRIFDEKHWNEPRKWNTQARKAGIPARVFCGSMCDVFEIHDIPRYNNLVLNPERAKLWSLIEETPHLIWMLLTKRPVNIERHLPESWILDGLPRNVWFGYSASTQDDLNRGWPIVKSFGYFHHPAAIFLSLEPLLGPIDLEMWLEEEPGYADEETYERGYRPIDWVIVGGESGSKARPMHPNWARAIRDQCRDADVPFFMKQDTGLRPGQQGNLPDDLWLCKELPNAERETQ